MTEGYGSARDCYCVKCNSNAVNEAYPLLLMTDMATTPLAIPNRLSSIYPPVYI